MKFQKLTIHNIASIKDAEINFEETPLSDSDVFLITGKTGSGKSTILDAICLALYNNTPRLASNLMEGKDGSNDNDMKLKDPRQMMRRNTGEAKVKLTFTGNNGKHYEAEWEVHRADQKPDGNLQSKTWKLTDIDAKLTINKDREIEAEIKAAIGLDFKQFTRTTLLAQGEFTKFLNSKDDEKAAILEKITGATEYSEIGKKVFNITKAKESIMEKAQMAIAGIVTLTVDQIQEKNEEIAQLDNQYQTMGQEIESDTKKKNWIEKDNELAKKVKGLEEDEKKAREATETAEFKQEEKTVKDWDATIEARQWMKDKDAADNDIAEQNKKLEEQQAKFTALLGGFQFAQQQKAQFKKEQETLGKYLQYHQAKANVYANVQAINAQLTIIDSGRDEILNKQKSIKAQEKLRDETLQPKSIAASEKYNTKKEAFDKEEKAVKDAEQAVSDLKLEKKRKNLQEYTTLLNDIAIAEERLRTLNTEQGKREETEKVLTKRLETINNKKQQSVGLDQPIKEAKQKMDSCEEAYNKQKDTTDSLIKTLRVNLQNGDICPVCRQKIIKSIIPQEKELEAIITGLKKEFEKAKSEHKKKVDEQRNLNAEIKADQGSYDTDKSTFDNDKTVAQAQTRALEACEKCGLTTLENAQKELDKLEKSTKMKKSGLEAEIKKDSAKEEKARELRNKLEEKRPDIETLRTKAEEALKAVEKCNQEIAKDTGIINQKQKDINQAHNKADQFISDTQWDIDWDTEPKQFAEHLKTIADEYNEKKRQKQTTDIKFTKAKDDCDDTERVINAILKDMAKWKKLQPDETASIDNIVKEANIIQSAVSSAVALIGEANNRSEKCAPKLKKFLNENANISVERLQELDRLDATTIEGKRESIREKHSAAETQKSLLDQTKSEQTEHSRTKPELNENDTIETLTQNIGKLQREQREIDKNLGSKRQELQSNNKQLEKQGNLETEKRNKEAEYRKWERLNNLIGDSEGKTFRKIAQSYILSSLIHEANKYMETLTDRYRLKVTPGTFIISVEDAYQGYASRAASTISGGESFLVSLSLALALSDIGHNLSADTLFIDEGFGTLSGEPLQNAINTLRSLHTSSNRHVGIISHIDELKERIPVQIQVRQEGNQSHSFINVIP